MISVLASAIHHTMEYGDFKIYVVQEDTQQEHVVLVRGNIEGGENILCRVSSECLPGTALFSAECDCKEQIQFSLQKIAQAEQGIFIYLRQEGRGHGLATKIRALSNKNHGLDTFAAVECMGLDADVREYSIVKSILGFFQIKSIICICNNPDKIKSIQREGVFINSVINIPVSATPFSLPHLKAKQQRGHNVRFISDKDSKY